MAFRGSFDYTLDAKNRLTIPAKFRGVFSLDGVVLARVHDAQCFSIWCAADFDAHVQSLLATFVPVSEEFQAFQRFYGANSHDTELDGAGRVMVPAKLLAVTSTQRDVVVNGVGNRLEVWARDEWERVSAELTDTVKRIGPALGNAA